MKTEVSSDKPITDGIRNAVVSTVGTGLSRFTDRLTRAEVHLKNADGSDTGRDVECALEVRPAGRDPVVAKDQAASAEEAVGGAVGKMDRLLDSAFGKSDSHKGGLSASGQES